MSRSDGFPWPTKGALATESIAVRREERQARSFTSCNDPGRETSGPQNPRGCRRSVRPLVCQLGTGSRLSAAASAVAGV